MSQATTEPTTPTTGDVLARVGETLAALQDAEKTCVEAAQKLYEHTQDGNAHGAGLQENIGREVPRPVWQGTALAFQKADGTTVAEAVDLKGQKGDRGEAGPRPEHRWDGTCLTVQSADGSWPESGVDLKGGKGDRGDIGPRPEHRWDGTRLTVQNADGSWPESGVDLKGEKGDAGEVILSDAVDSESRTTSASSLAVKTAYDAATAARVTADAAGEAAGEAKTTAEAASTAAAGATQKAEEALAAVPRIDALESRFDENGKLQAENLPLTDALDSAPGTLAASDTAVKTLNDRLNGLISSPADSSLWIGVPRPWRSTALPPSHCWANGDFVAFADWPELEQVYAAGGFEGMLMAWDADSGTQAANLGKWRPDAAEPTGLYTPQLSKQFLRCFVGTDGDQTAGTSHKDTMRPITGQATSYGYYTVSGALAFEQSTKGAANGAPTNLGTIKLDSRWLGANYSGTETAPVHVYQPYIIYLGNPAKETA